jgi:hypothetical protein
MDDQRPNTRAKEFPKLPAWYEQRTVNQEPGNFTSQSAQRKKEHVSEPSLWEDLNTNTQLFPLLGTTAVQFFFPQLSQEFPKKLRGKNEIGACRDEDRILKRPPKQPAWIQEVTLLHGGEISRCSG